MFEFPVPVFLDTNIFISSKYDFSSEGGLASLEKLILSKKVKLYTNNIVIKEVESNIYKDVNKLVNNYSKANYELLKPISKNMIKSSSVSSQFPDIDKKSLKNTLREELCKSFRDFLKNNDTIILDNKAVNIDNVLNDYFECNPPFEEKKKSEFPDAIIAYSIKEELYNISNLCIVSEDKGFTSAFKNDASFNIYNNLNSFLDVINSQNNIYIKFMTYLNLNQTKKIIRDKIDNEFSFQCRHNYVDGMDYDRYGYTGGFDYEDTYLKDIEYLHLNKFSVVEIDTESEKVTLSIECEAKIIMLCTYTDYEHSIWDCEEKEYLVLSSKDMQETHITTFNSELEFTIEDKEEFSLCQDAYYDIDIILNQETRVDRVEIKEDE